MDPEAVGDVELRHVRCLVALAEEGTFTDAAIALGLTQSAVSRSLAQLEARIGVLLVQRTTRQLALTAEGVVFRDHALRALAAVDDAIAAARGGVRPLRLGFSWAAAGRHTASLLRQWRTTHPDVELQVVQSDDRTAGLASGAADVVVVRVPITGPDFVTEVLFDEPRFVAVADDHPLAERRSLLLDDLLTETLVISSTNGSTTLDLWPAGRAPTRTIDVTNIDEWLIAIESGQGIGITAASTADQNARPGLAFVRLRDVPPVPVSVVYESSRKHPRTDELLELARSIVRSDRIRHRR